MTSTTSTITDFTQYTNLRKAAGENDPAALREVANQFEALFLQTMLKSMREASLGDPLFGDSEQMEMYQGMMDQQLAVELASGKGVGLADMLVRQLGGESASVEHRMETVLPPQQSTSVAQQIAPTVLKSQSPAWTDPVKFARDIWPHAVRTAKQLDVAPEAIVAQAALETGWGKHVIPDESGAASYNLFGIKGGDGWKGNQVVRNTLEFVDGVPEQQQARFRSYDDVASAFSDYRNLLASNPRYATVSGHGKDAASFARALQDSGYATDPDYATKITNVMEGPTMRRVLSDLKAGN